MTTTIHFYTGTGNSLWVARTLAGLLDETSVVPLVRDRPAAAPDPASCVGLVFPVHMWGVPAPVLDFCRTLAVAPGAYLFALAVNAGQVSRTLVQLREVLARRQLVLASGFDIVLPSNYLPWGGPGPAAELQRRFDETQRKLEQIAPLIRNRETRPVERGPLWQRVLFTGLYHLSFRQIPRMDRDFWVDERCNGCATCEKVCPADNIRLVEGRPVWSHRCEQCLACIQWCPREALQYGKKTPRYERYHHPQVKLAELIRARQSPPAP